MKEKKGFHPSEDTWELYSLQRLREPELSSVEEHLLVCPKCQALLEQVDRFVPTMKQALAEERGRPDRPDSLLWLKQLVFSNPMRLAGLAGVAVLIVLLSLLIPFRPSKQLNYQAIVLQSARGLERANTVKAGPGLEIRIELADLPRYDRYRLDLVNERGGLMWRAPETALGDRISDRISVGLTPGSYWIRLYGALKNDLLREYSLQVL